MKQTHPFRHASVFVVGFGLVFAVLGISAGAIGRLVPSILPVLRTAGGVLLILFGLVMAGLVGRASERIRAKPGWEHRGWSNSLVRLLDFLQFLLYSDRRLQLPTSRPGYPASLATGAVFAAGWSPCLGPILSAILLLAAEQQTVWQAAILMVIYTLGLAVPFLAVGLALERMTALIRRINRHAGFISVISGLFLIFTGWLLVSGRLLDLSAELIYLFGLGFGLEEVLLGASAVSLPLAFLAGILSFFSPCVLPLIPAYIGYLSGVAIDVKARVSPQHN